MSTKASALRAALVPEVAKQTLTLGRLLDHWFSGVVAEFGLTSTQSATLRYLYDYGSARQKELAEHLDCDASNVTAVADRLEERGLIARRPHPDDRRVRILELTDRGAAMVDDVWARGNETCPIRVLATDDLARLRDLLGEVLTGAGVEWPADGAAPSTGRTGRP